jgi:UDP-hydrolysing UDP-N-acetyl-D-glucosamine 2-epimerase
MKLVCVLTARPSYSRIRTALEALQPVTDLTVLCAGAACHPRYGRVVDQVRAHGFTVQELGGLWDEDHPAGMAHMTGHQTVRLADALRALAPDAVITVADRYETLATAIAASYQGLPLIHVQGGEVSGNIDDKVRHAVTQLADLHLVATAHAAERVQAMRPKGRIHLTGCPSIDLALRVPDGEVALHGIGPAVDTARPFLLVLHHPVTDEWQDAAGQTAELLAAVEECKWPTVWCWPNVDAGAAGVEKALRVAHERGAAIRFVRHVDGEDFIRLLRRCALLIGNSSAGLREGSALATPVLNLGRRQLGRETGPNVVTRATVTTRDIRWCLQQPRPQPSRLYGDGQAGARMARIILDWHQR